MHTWQQALHYGTLFRLDNQCSTRAAMSPSSGSSGNAGVAKAVRASRAAWIDDLRLLLRDARTRYGDVCWRVEGNDDEIYGHKGVKGFASPQP